MALINCTECGKEISDSAERCPHCGCKTPHGKTRSDAKVQLAVLIINVLMIVIGAILFLPHISTFLSNFSDKYFWQGMEYSEEVRTIVFRTIFGLGLFIGGTCGVVSLNKQLKKEQVTMITEPSPEETILIIDSIPASKQQYGTCQKCGADASLAVCRVRDLPYDYKLCLSCINKYGARIKE